MADRYIVMSDNLAKRVLKGDARAAAQLITLIERGDPRSKTVLRTIYPRTGNAHIVGITGAAGTGKSTILDCLTAELRRRKKSVGILAVDPTSPFSGGALLGDRVRMRNHFLDKSVFIRSLAARGGYGGVSASVRGAAHLLDAMGKEIVFIETIGAGQDQVEISALAHSVVVVLTPSMGDEIQAMKAGLLEIADILVVNKSDLPGAEEVVQQLQELHNNSEAPILKMSALTGEGAGSLIDALEKRRTNLFSSGLRRSRNFDLCHSELVALLQERTLAKALKKMTGASMARLVKRVADRKVDPYTALETIAKKAGI